MSANPGINCKTRPHSQVAGMHAAAHGSAGWLRPLSQPAALTCGASCWLARACRWCRPGRAPLLPRRPLASVGPTRSSRPRRSAARATRVSVACRARPREAVRHNWLPVPARMTLTVRTEICCADACGGRHQASLTG
jgi:hypothetical protein